MVVVEVEVEGEKPQRTEQGALSRFQDYFLENPCDCGQDFKPLISSGRLSLVLLPPPPTLPLSPTTAWEYLGTDDPRCRGKKRTGFWEEEGGGGGKERMRW